MSNKSRAWYSSSFDEILESSDEIILGHLYSNSDYAILDTQKFAWIKQFELLRKSLRGLKGTIHLEYNIPRMGRRIDAVLIIGPIIFVVEFKVGASQIDRSSINQVWDYALDFAKYPNGKIVDLLHKHGGKTSEGLSGEYKARRK